jgi:hypothetical protein
MSKASSWVTPELCVSYWTAKAEIAGEGLAAGAKEAPQASVTPRAGGHLDRVCHLSEWPMELDAQAPAAVSYEVRQVLSPRQQVRTAANRLPEKVGRRLPRLIARLLQEM